MYLIELISTEAWNFYRSLIYASPENTIQISTVSDVQKPESRHSRPGPAECTEPVLLWSGMLRGLHYNHYM